MAMIALGVFMYACIAGEGDSIMASLKALWRHEAMTGPYRSSGGLGAFGVLGSFGAFDAFDAFGGFTFEGNPCGGGA